MRSMQASGGRGSTSLPLPAGFVQASLLWLALIPLGGGSWTNLAAQPVPPPQVPENDPIARFLALVVEDRQRLPQLPSGLVPEDKPFGPIVVPAPAGQAAISDALRDSAQDWLELAIQAGEAKHWSLAALAVRHALARDPDLAEARRLDGFVRDPETQGDPNAIWTTPERIALRKRGYVDHPQQGWIDASWVRAVNQGFLPAVGTERAPRFVAEALADAQRAGMNPGWVVETDFFTIQSNLPRRDIVRLGRKLDRFREALVRLMADALSPRFTLASRALDGSSTARPVGFRHEVVIFADASSYRDHLRTRHGFDAGESLGVYLPAPLLKRRGSRGTVFLHRDPKADLDFETTLFHETTHLLLAELNGRGAPRDEGPGFWIFEAVATYFETTRVNEDGSVVFGTPETERLLVGRHRVVERGERVPLAQLLRLDKTRFHNRDHVFLNYVHAQALAAMLMNDARLTPREVFLDLVKRAYSSTGPAADRGPSLFDRLGESPQQLEHRLNQFLAEHVPKVEVIRRTSPDKTNRNRSE